MRLPHKAVVSAAVEEEEVAVEWGGSDGRSDAQSRPLGWSAIPRMAASICSRSSSVRSPETSRVGPRMGVPSREASLSPAEASQASCHRARSSSSPFSVEGSAERISPRCGSALLRFHGRNNAPIRTPTRSFWARARSHPQHKQAVWNTRSALARFCCRSGSVALSSARSQSLSWMIAALRYWLWKGWPTLNQKNRGIEAPSVMYPSSTP